MSTKTRWTSADLESFPDDDGKRYEIIDGELYVSKAPDWFHQYTCGEVYSALQSWSKRSGAGVANGAPGLICADDDDVIPDIVWVSAERLPHILGEDGKLHDAPELAVEVLSPGSRNVRRDRDAKLRLYSRRGVAEYWIIDWRARRMDVYRRGAEGLVLVAALGEHDELTSPLLLGFSARVADLLPA